MANEKTRTELIDEARWSTEQGKDKLLVARAYKPRAFDKKAEVEKWSGKSLGIGTRIVVRERNGNDVLGYMLGTIIDFEDTKDWWDTQTKLIVEITEVSSPKLQEHVGRLRSCAITQHYWGASRSVVDIGREAWADYQPSGVNVSA